MPAKLALAQPDTLVAYPDQVAYRYPDGRVVAVGKGGVYLYRQVPNAALVDARTEHDVVAAGAMIDSALRELAEVSGSHPVKRRQVASGAYRQIHLTGAAVPTPFAPAGGGEQARYLAETFRDRAVPRKVVLLGVRLTSRLTRGGVREAALSIYESFFGSGVPLAEFDQDYRRIDAIMARAGLVSPSDDDFQLANSWWTSGTGLSTPYMPHGDHMHVFGDPETVGDAATLVAEKVPCDQWPDFPRHHTLSFAAVRQVPLPHPCANSPGAWWVNAMFAQGAVAFSLRGGVEPGVITAAELRRARGKFTEEVNSRWANRRLDRSEQDAILADLTTAEAYFANTGTPTIAHGSAIVAFAGRHRRDGYNPELIGRHAGVVLDSMMWVPDAALLEMQIASPYRVNPHKLDLPTQSVAYAGLNDQSSAGDPSGALLGFTEHDGQPVYVSPVAASKGDAPPLMFVGGTTGSGKTQAGLWLATQFARIPNAAGAPTPVVFIDPKPRSDHSRIVVHHGGRTNTLDDVTSADGLYDPMRYGDIGAISGVEESHANIMACNPFGTGAAEAEVPLLQGLSYGARQGGACTMHALRIALRDNRIDERIVEAIANTRAAMPTFAALCGQDPEGPPLRASTGLTYVRIGTSALKLPPVGARPENVQQRVSVALVRAMVYGTMMAVAKRQGVVLMDEGWVFTSGGATELDRLGRIARELEVLAILLTQKATDAEDIGLKNFIAQALLFNISDPAEAAAACATVGATVASVPNPDLMRRILAPASDRGRPNTHSLRPIRDEAGQVLRGSVAYYLDLHNRLVPVVIDLPPDFLALSSTNPDDMRRRDAAGA